MKEEPRERPRFGGASEAPSEPTDREIPASLTGRVWWEGDRLVVRDTGYRSGDLAVAWTLVLIGFALVPYGWIVLTFALFGRGPGAPDGVPLGRARSPALRTAGGARAALHGRTDVAGALHTHRGRRR